MRTRRGWKKAVRRHQVQSRHSADAQDRAIETAERQAAQREIERELAELDREEEGD